MTLKGHGKFGRKVTTGSQFSPEKICQFRFSEPEGSNFKFEGIVFPEMYIGWAKNCGTSLMLWYWKAMESLGEKRLLVSNSAQKKSANFIPASQRVQISNFMRWFFLKVTLAEPKTLAGVSSYDTEGSWQVWERTDSWFPIQPRKKSSNFFPASHRVQISNLMGWFFLKGTLV